MKIFLATWDRKLHRFYSQPFGIKIFPTLNFLIEFCPTAHLAHLVLPNPQANASQNQKSQIFHCF